MEDYHAYSASDDQMPKFRSYTHDFFIVLPNLNYGQEGVVYMEDKTTQKDENTTQKTYRSSEDFLKILFSISLSNIRRNTT